MVPLDTEINPSSKSVAPKMIFWGKRTPRPPSGKFQVHYLNEMPELLMTGYSNGGPECNLVFKTLVQKLFSLSHFVFNNLSLVLK